MAGLGWAGLGWAGLGWAGLAAACFMHARSASACCIVYSPACKHVRCCRAMSSGGALVTTFDIILPPLYQMVSGDSQLTTSGA